MNHDEYCDCGGCKAADAAAQGYAVPAPLPAKADVAKWPEILRRISYSHYNEKSLDRRIDDMLAIAAAEMNAKDAEIVKWKAYHDEMVARNKLLRNRPDLPLERVWGYDQIMAEIATKDDSIEKSEYLLRVRDAEIAQLKADLAAARWKAFDETRELAAKVCDCGKVPLDNPPAECQTGYNQAMRNAAAWIRDMPLPSK